MRPRCRTSSAAIPRGCSAVAGAVEEETLPTPKRADDDGEKKSFWMLTPCGDGGTDNFAPSGAEFLLTRLRGSVIFVSVASGFAPMCKRGRERSTADADRISLSRSGRN
jgi:hypothetical protein